MMMIDSGWFHVHPIVDGSICIVKSLSIWYTFNGRNNRFEQYQSTYDNKVICNVWCYCWHNKAIQETTPLVVVTYTTTTTMMNMWTSNNNKKNQQHTVTFMIWLSFFINDPKKLRGILTDRHELNKKKEANKWELLS